MKFAAVLRNSAEELPDLADLFALYKQLKKSLKRIPNRGNADDHSQASQDTQPSGQVAAAAGGSGAAEEEQVGGPCAQQEQPGGASPQQRSAPGAAELAAGGPQAQEVPDPAALTATREAAAAAGAAAELPPAVGSGMAGASVAAAAAAAAAGGQQGAGADLAKLDEQEEVFLRTITDDVQKLNDSYIEKEELNVIKLGTLEEKAAAAKSLSEVQEAYKAFVDFHGELLLLLHWSILAYTGLVKILKKHHKRTGLLLRAPHLENLLSQPFCSVEVTCDMVRRAEAQVNALAFRLQMPGVDSLAAAGAAAAAAAAAAQMGPAETVNSPLVHVTSAGNLRAMAAAAAAAAGGAGQPGGEGAAGAARSGGGSAGAAGAPVVVPPAAAASAAAAGAEAGPSAPVAPAGAAGASGSGAPALSGQKRDASAMEAQGSEMMRRTRAALNVWKQLQVTAATPSTVLPAGHAVLPPGAAAAASGMTNSSVA